MNKSTRLVILMFFSTAFGLLYLWHDTAEAARMGRGGSFGSRPSYQRSAPPPPQSPSASPAKPGQTAQPQPPGLTPAPSGRWGGMLGGLLMGGMIGSLLFGGGLGFGPGLLDLLLIGGGLLLLFRFMRARRMGMAAPSAGGAMSFERSPASAWGAGNVTPSPAAPAAQPPALPPGFDADEFLKGANDIYIRLQAAWDKRDLADIRQFTSPEVYMEIRQQAEEDPAPGKTELLLINLRLIEVRDSGGQTIASVLYDVMLRENEDERSKQIRELWHFSKDSGRPGSFWVLEGIQQVA